MQRALLFTCLLWACDDGDSSTRDLGPADAGDLGGAVLGARDAAALDAMAPDMGPPGCPEPGTPTSYDVVGWTVAVDPSGGRWTITPPHGGEPILRSASACVDGVAEAPVALTDGPPGVQNSFGGFRFDAARQALRRPDPAPSLTETAGGIDITWDLPEGPLTLRFEPFPGGGLWIGLRAEAMTGGELSLGCLPEEAFFGLGTQVTGMDLRGRVYPLWTQEQGIGKPENGQPFPVANIPEAAYAPMGVWHSSWGYSAVIGHDAWSLLDLCATDPERVTLRSYPELPSFVLMPGETPPARMEAVTELVGRQTDPPAWVFAPWNDAVGGPERLREVAARLRAEGVPSSAIWSEDWIGGEQSAAGYRLSYAWIWDPEAYPALGEEIEGLHAQGFAFLGYFNPFVPEPTPMWGEGLEGGWLLEDADGALISFLDPAFRDASMVDLSDPEARAWFRGYAEIAARDLGIDGWMADFAEWLPVETMLRDGTDGWRGHNPYPLAWQRVNREAMEAVHAEDPRGADDWTFFVRSGWASVNGGTAGLAPALWAGDQNTDWDRDDGFPTVVPIGAHVGLAGVAIYGHDIAGYTSVLNPNTDKELFYRWAALGAFHPLMRTHHGSDECGNWAFDRDAETLAHFRRYARIHTLLYPYLRLASDVATATGLPITRHPWLQEWAIPEFWGAAEDIYFLGADLLVAPIVEQGATSRAVRLPTTEWWPLLGDARVGGAEIEVEAAPTEIPVFVRPGTILPLLGAVVDSFYGAEDEGVTDLEDVAGWHRLGLYPAHLGELRPTLGVTGGGFGARPEWTAAHFGGDPLPPCGVPPCARPDGIEVIGPGRVEVGDAWLEVPEGRWDVAWAGEVFGVDAAPTPLTDLNPDIPPPCEE